MSSYFASATPRPTLDPILVKSSGINLIEFICHQKCVHRTVLN